MYLDYAENQAERTYVRLGRKVECVPLIQWAGNSWNIEEISAKVTEQLALQEYEKFNQNGLVRNVDDSDFNEFIRKNKRWKWTIWGDERSNSNWKME